MKILMINGSAHEKGCTYTALSEIAAVLKAEGVDSEIIQLGGEPYRARLSNSAANRIAIVSVAVFAAKSASAFLTMTLSTNWWKKPKLPMGLFSARRSIMRIRRGVF